MQMTRRRRNGETPRAIRTSHARWYDFGYRHGVSGAHAARPYGDMEGRTARWLEHQARNQAYIQGWVTGFRQFQDA